MTASRKFKPSNVAGKGTTLTVSCFCQSLVKKQCEILAITFNMMERRKSHSVGYRKVKECWCNKQILKHLPLSFSISYNLCTYILCSHRGCYWLNHKGKISNFLCSPYLIFLILLLYPNISAVLVFVNNDFKSDSNTQWDGFFFPFTEKSKQTQCDPNIFFFIALGDSQTLPTSAIDEIHIS